MTVDVYWINGEVRGRLGIMARPRGGDWLDEEFRSLSRQEVQVVVSLLTDEEIRELDLPGEELTCRMNGIDFVRFPIRDRSVPESVPAARELIQRLRERLMNGESIVIHCRAGIGRASLVAAALLTLEGPTPAQAFACIAEARGCPVPDTPQQANWVRDVFGNGSRSEAGFADGNERVE